MRIAMIPARGGSKRIPGKNIKPFCGRPIIEYSIEAALESNLFDKVICSTDSENIATAAQSAGAEIPFMRPADIADDYATTMDVIAHSLEFYENSGHEVEAICCLYATAPFVRAEDLKQGYALLDDSGAQFVFSATSYAFPIQRAFYLDDQQRASAFSPEYLDSRSQDLVEAYHDAGQFYWCRSQAIRQKLPFFARHSAPLILDRKRVQDIDTPQDWDFAEALFTLSRDKS